MNTFIGYRTEPFVYNIKIRGNDSELVNGTNNALKSIIKFQLCDEIKKDDIEAIKISINCNEVTQFDNNCLNSDLEFDVFGNNSELKLIPLAYLTHSEIDVIVKVFNNTFKKSSLKLNVFYNNDLKYMEPFLQNIDNSFKIPMKNDARDDNTLVISHGMAICKYSI